MLTWRNTNYLNLLKMKQQLFIWWNCLTSTVFTKHWLLMKYRCFEKHLLHWSIRAIQCYLWQLMDSISCVESVQPKILSGKILLTIKNGLHIGKDSFKMHFKWIGLFQFVVCHSINSVYCNQRCLKVYNSHHRLFWRTVLIKALMI